MKLEETKELYAQQSFAESWEETIQGLSPEGIEHHMNEVVRLYAKAKLEEAAELCSETEDNRFEHASYIKEISLD